jgi:hypothetical protein
MRTRAVTQRRIAELEYKLLALKADYVFLRLMLALKAGFNPNQPRDDHGRWTIEGGVSVTTSSGFYTGIQSIDETSDALSDILASVMNGLEYLPSMNPSVYGTLVHGLFGAAVRLRGLPGVGDIEQTFSLDDADPYYGIAGSIRTDVTLRNIQGDIIAIYDVKTGDASLSRARADELRLKTNAAPNTPVFELNIARGISRKSLGLMRRHSP